MLEINFRNQISAQNSVIIVIVVMTLALLYTGYKSTFDLSLFIFFGIFTLLNIGPALAIHFEYYKLNKKSKYLISEHFLVQLTGEYERRFSSDDIDRIVIYMSPSVYKGSQIRILAIEDYYFAKVKLKSNERIILTCLLSNNLEETLKQMKNVEIVRKRALFASVAYWA